MRKSRNKWVVTKVTPEQIASTLFTEEEMGKNLLHIDNPDRMGEKPFIPYTQKYKYYLLSVMNRPDCL